MDKINALKKLKSLLDEGVITEEEFKKEKYHILNDEASEEPKNDVASEESTPLPESYQTVSVDDSSDDVFVSPGEAIAIVSTVLIIAAILIVVLSNKSSEKTPSHTDPAPVITYQKTTDSQPRSEESVVLSGEVFTVVYATSDDGFLNVRSEPSNNGRILTELYGMYFGLGSGVLLERGESWSKVSVNGIVGWCYNKYLGYQTWYTGKGKTMLIAKSNNTPIYGEDLSGEGHRPVFARVKKGVIIGDDYDEFNGYYVLATADTGLYVSKNDVIIR